MNSPFFVNIIKRLRRPVFGVHCFLVAFTIMFTSTPALGVVLQVVSVPVLYFYLFRVFPESGVKK